MYNVTLDTTGEYWFYLRKSRSDLEAEQRGEGETLAKHRKALFALAKRLSLNVTEVFEEIVSGESLFHRPEMLKLMEMMEQRPPKGVLVMDLDRLGRGNMQEQGLILDSFRRSNVYIITPNKIYDLRNESDELMTEVESLFARQELKIITRRLQRGRVASVEEGNYIATRPPYGYKIFKEGKERFLVPHPEQAPIVRQIFEWYAESLGANKIANRLNEMGVRSYTGKLWLGSAVLNILKNEVYIGLIQWRKKEQKKSKELGKKRDTKTRDRSEWISVKGKHEPLVSEDIFHKAQAFLKTKYHVPYQLENGITNPLAGLIKCAKCGYSMVYRPYTNQPGHIMCHNKECDNRSSRMAFVEEKLLLALEEWLEKYMFNLRKRENKVANMEAHMTIISELEREIVELDVQKNRLYDFLERRIYSEEVFLERSNNIQSRMENAKVALERTRAEMKQETDRKKTINNIIPEVKNVINVYRKSKDAAKKNALLKSIVVQATYKKEKTQRGNEFSLEVEMLLDI